MHSRFLNRTIIPRKQRGHPLSGWEMLGLSLAGILIVTTLHLLHSSIRAQMLAIEAVFVGFLVFRYLRMISRR